MRKIHIVGLALVAVLALSAFATTSAFSFEYLVSGNKITGAEKWDVDLTIGAGGLLLEDMQQGIDILCTEGVGLLSLTGPSTNTKEKFECLKLESMTTGVTCSALVVLDLPWESEQSGETELILKGTGGNPGWLAECTVLGIKADDTCTTTAETATISNSTEEEALEEFLESATEAEFAECSLSGSKKVGLIVGSFRWKALSANGLELLTVGANF